jgi:hypothetical protein
MPDKTNSNGDADANNQNNTENQPGTVPDQKTVAGGQGTFDPSTVGDEDFDKVFDDPRVWKHPRFKSLVEAKDRLKAIEKKEAEEREAKLLEEKKFQELLEEKDKKISELTQNQQRMLLDSKISTAALKAGAVDTEAILKLIDRANITLNDDGSVAGVEEAIKTLLETKPYLVGSDQQPTVGAGTNPGANTTSSAKRFKLSQLQDRAFYQANEADIDQALRLGLVEDDMSQ